MPLAKRIGLRLHLFVCALCRTYEKQVMALCGISHQAGLEAPPHVHLPHDRKQAIQDALKRN